MPTRVNDRTPLIAYLKVQRASDRDVAAALRSASASISRALAQLGNGVGGQVRADQLMLAQLAIERELAQLWRRVGDITRARQAEAAAAAIQSSYPVNNLRRVMSSSEVTQLLRAAEAQARRGADTLSTRLNLSRIPLVESVYKNQQVSTGKVDQIVNDALARGASAAELARDVRAYVNPNTPGGVKYAAHRLGRTELNNAFHAQQVQSGITNPMVLTLRWNLSGSHPTPDQCNVYAESVHFEGGEAGQWRPEEIPGKPHPQCLCYTTPEVDDFDTFVRRFDAGAFDDHLADLGVPRAR